jgi:hypothetical protein
MRPPVQATFTEFLATLVFWETELISNLTMLVDCYKFVQMVETQRHRNTDIKFLTMSDGSNESGAMAFGWIISLPDGTCLTKCSGPVYGPFGTSFPAEGYGFLSVTQLIF